LTKVSDIPPGAANRFGTQHRFQFLVNLTSPFARLRIVLNDGDVHYVFRSRQAGNQLLQAADGMGIVSSRHMSFGFNFTN
jgi:hypothetical protein